MKKHGFAALVAMENVKNQILSKNYDCDLHLKNRVHAKYVKSQIFIHKLT